jgi:hypothetical protein
VAPYAIGQRCPSTYSNGELDDQCVNVNRFYVGWDNYFVFRIVYLYDRPLDTKVMGYRPCTGCAFLCERRPDSGYP